MLGVLATTGCAMRGGGGGWRDEPDPVVDACPVGATLRVQLWDVYATPRKPSGEVWDGVSAGTRELFCDVGADIIRRRAAEAATSYAGPVGTIGDRIVGDAFEEVVADLCGLATGWLQSNYEGPDLFAYGAFADDADWRWVTYAEQDSWAARLSTTRAGGPAEWQISCDDRWRTGQLYVIDEDVAFDDDVANLLIDLSSITDGDICDGWVYFEGAQGVAGLLFRLEVVGGVSRCG